MLCVPIKATEDFTHPPFLQFRNKLKLQSKSLFIGIVPLGSWGGGDPGLATDQEKLKLSCECNKPPLWQRPDQCLLKSSHHFKRNGKANLGKSPCIIKWFLISKNYWFICSCASWHVGLQSPPGIRPSASATPLTDTAPASVRKPCWHGGWALSSDKQPAGRGGGWRGACLRTPGGPPVGSLYSEDMQSSPTQGNAPVKQGISQWTLSVSVPASRSSAQTAGRWAS